MSELRLYRCKECDRVVGSHTAAAIHTNRAAQIKARELASNPSVRFATADQRVILVEGHVCMPLSDEETVRLREQWKREGCRCSNCGGDHCEECCDFGECLGAAAVTAKVFVDAGGVIGQPGAPVPESDIAERALEILSTDRECRSQPVRDAVEWYVREHPPVVVEIVNTREEMIEYAAENPIHEGDL